MFKLYYTDQQGVRGSAVFKTKQGVSKFLSGDNSRASRFKVSRPFRDYELFAHHEGARHYDCNEKPLNWRGEYENKKYKGNNPFNIF